MIRSTLLYVVSVAGPALLLAIAADAVRSRRVRSLETLAWLATVSALLVVLVYPSLLSIVGIRVGVTGPVALAGFVGICGLFIGYDRQRDRLAALESDVSEVEGPARSDDRAVSAMDSQGGARTDQGKAARRNGDSARG